MSRLTVLIFSALVVLNLVLFGLFGLKLYTRHQRNQVYKTEAEQLLEAAKQWRTDNDSRWPETCVIDPGTAQLCPSGKDRDAIAKSSQLTDKYEIFVVDPPAEEDPSAGDILNNPVVAYGLQQNGLILVNKTICFQGRELTASNGFAVIYGREARSGKIAACV